MGCCVDPTPYPDGTYAHWNTERQFCPVGNGFDPQDCPKGNCTLTGMFGRHYVQRHGRDEIAMAALEPAMHDLFDVRYFLLVNSAAGRHLLDLYDRHAETIERAVEGDEALTTETLRVFTQALHFAKDMLRAHVLGRDAPYAGARRFDERLLVEGKRLTEKLRERVEGPEVELLDFVDEFFSGLVGKTAREVLMILDPRPVEESRLTAPSS